MTRDDAIKLILDELDRAEKKFPNWPVDPVHAAAIVAEESGELVKATMDWVYKGGEYEGEVEQEAVQTAAMALRFLMRRSQCIPRQYPGGRCE